MPLATWNKVRCTFTAGHSTDGKELLLQTKQCTADAATKGQEFAKHSKHKVRPVGAACSVQPGARLRYCCAPISGVAGHPGSSGSRELVLWSDGAVNNFSVCRPRGKLKAIATCDFPG